MTRSRVSGTSGDFLINCALDANPVNHKSGYLLNRVYRYNLPVPTFIKSIFIQVVRQ